jgi:polysaccharide export outer membrane protein
MLIRTHYSWSIKAAIALIHALLLARLLTFSLMAQDTQRLESPKLDYRLGGGDTLRIQVYQSPDLSLEARLNENGVLNYPLLGAITLGGLTVREAEQFIERGLQQGQYLRQPQVMVMVSQVRAHQVNVLGQVQRPGRYALDKPGMRLSDVLAIAGGITPMGSDHVVVVGQRQGQPWRLRLDLPSLLSQAQPEQDVELAHGDVVFVDRAPQVYIYGEVQRPGALRLERDMTLLQALAAGGGLTLRGTERGIKIWRTDSQGRLTALLPDMPQPLQAGDVVYVRESLF